MAPRKQPTPAANPKRTTISKSLSWDPKVLADSKKASKASGDNLSHWVMSQLRKIHRASPILT